MIAITIATTLERTARDFDRRNVPIPSSAVGSTQTCSTTPGRFYFRRAARPQQVFLDSPMAAQKRTTQP